MIITCETSGAKTSLLISGTVHKLSSSAVCRRGSTLPPPPVVDVGPIRRPNSVADLRVEKSKIKILIQMQRDDN